MFFGLSFPQEYVCLASEKIPESLSLTMKVGASEAIDVTANHIFLGYKPLVFAIPFASDSPVVGELSDAESITIDFRKSDVHKNHDHKVVARMRLKRVEHSRFKETIVFFFQGVTGRHRFISRFHQLTNRMRNRLGNDREGNVGLEGNLYDQVRIAYSIPRKINVITLSDGELMNMFPTDLHGMASSNIYLGSLRIGGKANQQVEKFGAIALSQIESSDYRAAYELGKNHMQDLRSVELFHCHSKRSAKFGLPLPASALQYNELKLLQSLDIGIHRIHVYEIVHSDTIKKGSPLTHIHKYYAQWRLDHHLSTEFLFR